MFYQPAYDHCAFELGLDPNGLEYESCYYAFPYYRPGDEIGNCCGAYANDNQRNDCIAALSQCLNSAPDVESVEFDLCAVNTGW